jgi:hypothetical protein
MHTKFLLGIVLILSSTTGLASSDPFVGKWKLDVHRSKYPDGTCPTRMLIEMHPAGQGVAYNSEATYRNGAETHAQYTAEYNGKPVIVMGTHGLMLPVSLKRLDERIVEAFYTRGAEIVATSRRVVSADGRKMTITTVSKNATGKRLKTVGVYSRQ